jgi:hypothetical protein
MGVARWFVDMVGRCGELGFGEVVFPEPEPGEWRAFEWVIRQKSASATPDWPRPRKTAPTDPGRRRPVAASSSVD